MTAPNTLHEHCRWAETWLPTLAPADLPGPIYILDASLPAEMDACVGEQIDLAYREELGTRWQGRGVAILIDLAKFRLDEDRMREVNHADDETIAEMEGYATKRLLRVLIHELGHVALWPAPSEEAPTTKQREQHARQVIDAELWTPAKPVDPRLPAPFFDHGGDFVRTSLHLHYRAKTLGVAAPLVGLAADFRYRMAPIDKYRAALGNECWRRRNAPLREIAKTPPPKKFAELWQHDVADWLRRCAKYGGLTDDVVLAAWLAANTLPGRTITQENLAIAAATN